MRYLIYIIIVVLVVIWAIVEYVIGTDGHAINALLLIAILLLAYKLIGGKPNTESSESLE